MPVPFFFVSIYPTKADDTHPHGLGIESTRTTAGKYGGTLENRFRNGKFYSTVFLNLKV